MRSPTSWWPVFFTVMLLGLLLWTRCVQRSLLCGTRCLRTNNVRKTQISSPLLTNHRKLSLLHSYLQTILEVWQKRLNQMWSDSIRVPSLKNLNCISTTRCFFLSLDTALGHVWPWWQVWLWHICYSLKNNNKKKQNKKQKKKKKKKKNKKKITKQIFDNATSVKTIDKQSSGTGMPSHIPAQP